jgi:hypothetical protein
MKLFRHRPYFNRVKDDEYAGPHLRFDYGDLFDDVRSWALSLRPKSLRGAENYVRAVEANVQRLHRLAEEARIRSIEHPTFSELMTLYVYQAEEGLREDLSRSMFGKDPGRGHRVPDASVFEGYRWVWDREPGPAKEWTGLQSVLHGGSAQNGKRTTWNIVTRKGAIKDPDKLEQWKHEGEMHGFSGINVIEDETVPFNQAYLINPDYLVHEPVVGWYPEGDPDDYHDLFDPNYEEWHDMGGDA